MTDTVLVSLVTALGMLATSITAAVIQYRIARLNSESEAERQSARIEKEANVRRIEARYNKIVEQVTALLIVVDPEINPNVNRPELARLIVSTQLLLDPKNESEGRLNGALTKLGMFCSAGLQENLSAGDEVITACREFVSKYHRS